MNFTKWLTLRFSDTGMLLFLKILLSLGFFSCLVYQLLKKSQLRPYRNLLVAAYVFRFFVGMLYGILFLRYYGGDDTWYFNRGATEEFEKLKASPLIFFTDFDPIKAFGHPHSFAHNFYVYLNDLEFWLITKPLALYHVFSGGAYSLNVILFNFLTFWGSIWLFESVISNVEKLNKAILALLFFFPPFAFWLSGIRGDTPVFLFVVLTLTQYRLLLQQPFSKKRWSLFLTGVAGMVVFRSPLVLVLVPALIAWVLHAKKGWSHLKSLGITYGLGLCLFFASGLNGGGLPGLVANRQAAFSHLRGNTRMELPALSSSPLSYLKAIPYAIRNVFIGQMPWQSKGLFQLAHALETLLLLALLSIAMIRYKKTLPLLAKHPAALYSLAFAFGLLFFIGLTIPFPGAIIRYKIIASSLIYLALLGCYWQLRKMTHQFSTNMV